MGMKRSTVKSRAWNARTSARKAKRKLVSKGKRTALRQERIRLRAESRLRRMGAKPSGRRRGRR